MVEVVGNWTVNGCTVSSYHKTSPLLRCVFAETVGRRYTRLRLRNKEFFYQTRKKKILLSGRNCLSPICSLTESLLVHLPEAGPLRDLAFTVIGASCSLALSAAAAWAWQREESRLRAAAAERGRAVLPEPSFVASKKESVEWVNMVVQKIWRIYRKGLESWLVGLLQPAIDKLPKPDYVTRVEIAEFSLNEEPITLRNVQRRASRRVNDLQYHIGLRYTGGATCLLVLHLNKGGFSTSIPVGVQNLDVDGELWVKLRLTPRKPFVGTLSIAFVRLPTIKLVLAPFRVFNLFAVPFLSRFLSKLLTVDLPKLIVLPRHITFDFLPSGVDVNQTSPVPPPPQDNSRFGTKRRTGALVHLEPNENFVGELTVTLCEARNLPTWNFSGLSNPYCVLTVDEHSLESKRNRETSHPAGSQDPVWNQDFQFLVEDPLRQKLVVRIRDSSMTLHPDIGFVQVPIWQLQDCVPVTVWSPILQEGPLGVKQIQGELRLLLTYKSYVDRENDPELRNLQVPYIKVFGEDGGESEDIIEKLSDSDRDDTAVFVLDSEGEEENSVRRKEYVSEAEDREDLVVREKVVENGVEEAEGGDWKALVVEKAVEIGSGTGKWVFDASLGTGKWIADKSVGTGKWVADKAVDLWEGLKGKKEEEENFNEELTGSTSSASGVEQYLPESFENGAGNESQSNGSIDSLVSGISKILSSLPKIGSQNEVIDLNSHDEVDEHRGPVVNGEVHFHEAPSEEIVESLLHSIAGELSHLKFVPRNEEVEFSESEFEETPEEAETASGGGFEVNGQSPKVNGTYNNSHKPNGTPKDPMAEETPVLGDISRESSASETVFEVNRTGALNKAIMELIDLFDKNAGVQK